MILSYRKFSIACANNCLNISSAFKKADVNIAALTKIKNGKNVNALTAGKLAQALGVSGESLLADEQ